MSETRKKSAHKYCDSLQLQRVRVWDKAKAVEPMSGEGAKRADLLTEADGVVNLFDITGVHPCQKELLSSTDLEPLAPIKLAIKRKARQY